jgi:hypothetical protein
VFACCCTAIRSTRSVSRSMAAVFACCWMAVAARIASIRSSRSSLLIYFFVIKVKEWRSVWFGLELWKFNARRLLDIN